MMVTFDKEAHRLCKVHTFISFYLGGCEILVEHVKDLLILLTLWNDRYQYYSIKHLI